MNTQIEPGVRELVVAYHAEQGDTHIRPMKYVEGENFSTAILVWLRDGKGNELSTLDMIFHDGHGRPYVTEFDSVERDKEDHMLQWFRGDLTDDEMMEDDCDAW